MSLQPASIYQLKACQLPCQNLLNVKRKKLTIECDEIENIGNSTKPGSEMSN